MKKALVLVATCCSFAGAGLLYAEETGSIEFLNSGKVLPANLPFSEAVRVDNVLYLSGQIGIVPGSVKLAAGGIKAEAKQTMENIKTSLRRTATQSTTLSNARSCWRISPSGGRSTKSTSPSLISAIQLGALWVRTDSRLARG
jgi:hypothetical protein